VGDRRGPLHRTSVKRVSIGDGILQKCSAENRSQTNSDLAGVGLAQLRVSLLALDCSHESARISR